MLETSMKNMEQELLEAENADLRRDRSSADGKGLSPIENQYKVIEKNTLYSFFGELLSDVPHRSSPYLIDPHNSSSFLITPYSYTHGSS